MGRSVCESCGCCNHCGQRHSSHLVEEDGTVIEECLEDPESSDEGRDTILRRLGIEPVTQSEIDRLLKRTNEQIELIDLREEVVVLRSLVDDGEVGD